MASRKAQFTPEEIITVVDSIIDKQHKANHKPGWCFYEMKRRVEQVGSRFSAYRIGLAGAEGIANSLGRYTQRIAEGKTSRDYLMERLEDCYDDYLAECERFGVAA